jgi:hypothetical protein
MKDTGYYFQLQGFMLAIWLPFTVTNAFLTNIEAGDSLFTLSLLAQLPQSVWTISKEKLQALMFTVS